MNHITTDDLRRMDGQEGLILQGCGGDLQEWAAGINRMLTENGVLLNGSRFENISIFQHQDLTNLLFSFEGVELNPGRLAIWRLRTHEQFGGTWLSDYVPNELGGFIHEQKSEKPDCPLIGEDGNIFNLIAIASRTLRRAGLQEQAEEMRERIMGGECGDYYAALNVIGKYVNITDKTEQAQFVEGECSLGKIFYAYAVNKNGPDSGIEAFLNLPASPYEMLDAMDKLRRSDSAGVKFVIDEYYRFGSLVPFLSEPNDLHELNALAQKLSELDDQQEVAFEGLLMIESRTKQAPIELSDLIDLAYSTDRCHVVGEALNDSQLGRFCAENGFVPGAEDLSDGLFELLDFERIGREHRQRERGVIVERTADHPGGYVEQHDELVKAYKTLDLTPKTPDYTILLELETGSCCSLPSAVLPQGRYACLDCKVPALTDMISEAGDIYAANRLAQRLSVMRPQVLNGYKALLEAVECRTLQQAEQLIDTLDVYTFSPEYSSPIEVAKGELSVILCDPEREQIMPHLNLYKYGQALIQDCGGVLTDYGLIEREDRQPIQVMEQPRQGGMEMS